MQLNFETESALVKDSKLAVAADTPTLDKNQKKRRRKKLSRLYKKTAPAGDVLSPAAADTITIDEEEEAAEEVDNDSPAGKRIKLSISEVPPQTIISAEPFQRRCPQLSLSSIAAAGAADSVVRPIQLRNLHQQQIESSPPQEDMPDPSAHRTDMTHVARFLVANQLNTTSVINYTATTTTTTGAVLPSSHFLPSSGNVVQSSSAVRGTHVVLQAAAAQPSESAASADQPRLVVGGGGNGSDFDDAAPISSAPTALTAITATATTPQQQQGALAAAPPLDAVAPKGPNGSRVYIYGNYHRYYGYRLGQAFSEDPRLSLFEKSWFAGRRCMDVGCNEGIITLGIATKFGTKSMIGVDVDEHLVGRACKHLREERTAAVLQSAAARKPGVPSAQRRHARTAVSALAQTWFVHGDFLEARAEARSVDCLTALSITKWVHLHRGDAGLRAFFARVHYLLAPGGLFIVEPQPWRSYKAAKGKMRKQGGGEGVQLPQGAFFHRLNELEIRPEQIPDILCAEFGFQLVRRLQPPEEASRGFDRDVFLFKKI